MDHLAQEILGRGLLDAQGQQDELTQFHGMMKRFAELLPQELGVGQLCNAIVRIIVEETSFSNCSILLWDQTKQLMDMSSAFGLPTKHTLEQSRRQF